MALWPDRLKMDDNKKYLKWRLGEYAEYIPRLSESDQEVYDLAVRKMGRQKEVAAWMGMTQGAVSSRLSKILKRVKFLKMLDSFDLSGMDEDLVDLLDTLEIEIVRNMVETTCQEETARRVNRLFGLSGKDAMNQIKVRYRFHQAWEKLTARRTRKYRKYAMLLGFIQDNLYMLHEVKNPYFEKGFIYEHEGIKAVLQDQ